jgi:rSAM/selenodomain-associated transferase 2
MRISVIMPTLNEEKGIAATLAALMALRPHEAIVVDGGSRDKTAQMGERAGAQVIISERGRARQMNRGAREANGDVLLFLHADTRLPVTAWADIGNALSDRRYVGGRFDIDLEGGHPMLKLIGAMISYRSRLTKVSTGDQALFVRREIFREMGGFPDIDLMEDIAFCRALKRIGRIACLRSKVISSARRWEMNGVWRTVSKMWILKLLYFVGVSPGTLKRFYADSR